MFSTFKTPIDFCYFEKSRFEILIFFFQPMFKNKTSLEFPFKIKVPPIPCHPKTVHYYLSYKTSKYSDNDTIFYYK